MKTTKPKVLLVLDEWNWGCHSRALAMEKHLSDEFDFDIVKVIDVANNIDSFIGKYDAVWLLLHTMLYYPPIRILASSTKSVATVTSNIIIKPIWEGLDKRDGDVNFKDWSNCLDLLAINNLRIENEARSLVNCPIRYAPRGVDEKTFSALPYTYPLKIGFVGKAKSNKNLEEVIIPASERAGLQVMKNTRNFTNAIPLESMPEFYKMIGVYVVASSSDGTPNPALEAASCGRPIISNWIGNMPEFIEDGVNGLLVPLNVNAYVEKLIWMKENPEWAEHMGQEARKTILQGWTWEHVLQNERGCLRELIM